MSETNLIPKEDKLTLKQELFCQLYATDREFFGNGTQAYIEAFDISPDKYATANANAARLLSSPKILKRIDELLEDLVLNDQNVDKQMAFWITQKAHPQASIAAIKEYNALKQRVIKKIEAKLTGDIPIALVEFVGDDSGEEESNTED